MATFLNDFIKNESIESLKNSGLSSSITNAGLHNFKIQDIYVTKDSPRLVIKLVRDDGAQLRVSTFATTNYINGVQSTTDQEFKPFVKNFLSNLARIALNNGDLHIGSLVNSAVMGKDTTKAGKEFEVARFKDLVDKEVVLGTHAEVSIIVEDGAEKVITKQALSFKTVFQKGTYKTFNEINTGVEKAVAYIKEEEELKTKVLPDSNFKDNKKVKSEIAILKKQLNGEEVSKPTQEVQEDDSNDFFNNI